MRLARILVPGAVAVASLAWATPAPGAPTAHSSVAPAPAPTATPVKHFVSIMQEMHSFDSYFGTYAGADGIPSGACMPPPGAVSATNPCIKPFPIGTAQSRRLSDTRATFAAQYAGGAMNGFVAAQSTRGVTNPLPMAHYEADQLPYYWSLADNYVLFDHYFASAAGGSLRNHMFWVTGSPGNLTSESVPTGGYGGLPTIFDRLEAKGVSWKFYVQGYDPAVTFRSPGPTPAQVARVPLLSYARYLDQPALASHIVPLDRYYTDLGNGSLPAVSYIVPAGPSETPPASVVNGQGFVRNIVAALKRSNAWPSSALMLSYADWGGWYDHVAPAQVDAFGLGFRVPALLVSPYARRGLVDHTALDHTSVLKFIERNWGVAPLAARDAGAGDLTNALDFHQPVRIPQLAIESGTPPKVPSGSLGVAYPAYGLAVLVGIGAIGYAVVGGRRRRRGVISG